LTFVDLRAVEVGNSVKNSVRNSVNHGENYGARWAEGRDRGAGPFGNFAGQPEVFAAPIKRGPERCNSAENWVGPS
jgi:hypothetical protein